ncbi:hypothetical protein Vretifemale_17808 [Volvox reticuliferus]|nr:hypothetical protein Vretifemale_17808 [Volvox reticuliferus]
MRPWLGDPGRPAKSPPPPSTALPLIGRDAWGKTVNVTGAPPPPPVPPPPPPALLPPLTGHPDTVSDLSDRSEVKWLRRGWSGVRHRVDRVEANAAEPAAGRYETYGAADATAAMAGGPLAAPLPPPLPPPAET